jgi:hypothetical protein
MHNLKFPTNLPIPDYTTQPIMDHRSTCSGINGTETESINSYIFRSTKFITESPPQKSFVPKMRKSQKQNKEKKRGGGGGGGEEREEFRHQSLHKAAIFVKGTKKKNNKITGVRYFAKFQDYRDNFLHPKLRLSLTAGENTKNKSQGIPRREKEE